MKLSSSLLVLASAIGLAACASRPPPASWRYEPASPPRTEPLSTLNQDLTAEVGGTIYTDGHRIFSNADQVRFASDAVAQLEVGHAIKVTAGSVAPLRLQTPGAAKAACVQTVKTGVLVRVVPGFTPVNACLIDKDGDGTFDVVLFERYAKEFPLQKPLAYAVETYPPSERVELGNVRREMLYAGASNGTLRLSYREFTDTGYARPSFSQDATYDLDARGQAEVGFKGLRLQVISATNSRLTYRVLRPMD